MKYLMVVKEWYDKLTDWKRAALWIGVGFLLFGMVKGVIG